MEVVRNGGRRRLGRKGARERGRGNGELETLIFETWLRHCNALRIYHFYFDAF